MEGKSDDTRPLHDEFVQKLRVDAETSEKRIETERDSALFRYRCVLRSIRGIFKAADERHAGHVGTLTQLRLLFEKERKVKTVASLTVPILEELMLQSWRVHSRQRSWNYKHCLDLRLQI